MRPNGQNFVAAMIQRLNGGKYLNFPPHFIRIFIRFFVHRDGIVSGKKDIL
jgi:hypothetical protein